MKEVTERERKRQRECVCVCIKNNNIKEERKRQREGVRVCAFHSLAYIPLYPSLHLPCSSQQLFLSCDKHC